MALIHKAREVIGDTHVPGFRTRSAPLSGRHPSRSHHSIIPGYIYKEISGAKEVPEHTRERARLNVERIDALNQAQGVLQGIVIGSAVPKHFYRVIRDANQKDESNGSVIVHEDAANANSVAATDDDVNRVWTDLEKIFDFYSTEFDRNSVDDKGLHLIATVHFDDDSGVTPGFMNAFWDPRTSEWYFGDGDGVIFDDFTKAIDIVAHEYTHAVTQYTANLPYWFQSGALNEHYSDVFGALVKQKFHADGPQKAKDADWLVGEGVFLDTARAPALRSMKDPGTAYNWEVIGGKDPQGKDMGEYQNLPEWQDNGGVHLNSGIPNRAFYLVAVAFQEDAARYNGYAWEEPGQIWYKTLVDPDFRAYFDAEVQRTNNGQTVEKNIKTAFKLFANLTIKHALALYQSTGRDIVRNAWKTVKVLP
ncbi:hypothetical protein LTR67_006202 [Exophiala xenobiotica]